MKVRVNGMNIMTACRLRRFFMIILFDKFQGNLFYVTYWLHLARHMIHVYIDIK